MKTDRNILIAFLLNLGFAIFEFIGGTITNSVAIISDSVHDIGDSLSIGISYFLEKKSKKKPDERYTYGYLRYSVMGSMITTMILIIGSVFVVYQAIKRIIHPVVVNYSGMIIFAVIGVIVNFLAAYSTRGSHSLNQKSVNLHMLEDVLGWVVVLIGAIVMQFTDISIIDPILSILVALFIFKSALENFKSILDLFLEKVPSEISVAKLKEHILKMKGIKDVHHIHVWSIDGFHNYATMHIVIDGKSDKMKELVKEELKEHGISHATIEIENSNEVCVEENCEIKMNHLEHHHHK